MKEEAELAIREGRIFQEERTVNTKAKTSLWEERKRIRLVGMWTTEKKQMCCETEVT